MGDDPIRGIREILDAQNSSSAPSSESSLFRLNVLPPIGGRAHSSSQPLIRENSPKSGRLNISDPALRRHIRRFSLITNASSRPSSTGDTPTVVEITAQGKGIVRVPFKIAQLSTILPAIPGLSIAVDNLTPHRLDSILSACRLYDSESRGYLSQPSVLKCIGEVVPSAHAVDSPWREFLEEIAPHGEFIDYNLLVDLIGQHQEIGKIPIDPIPSISEVLGTKQAKSLIQELPSRPTTSQASREKGRLEIILEIETILLRNPELDMEQLKLITHQKVMEQSEFLTLLELYGMLNHFQPFLNRLLDCFLTVDNKFHYSAFIGCLQTISLERPIDLNKTYRFALPPLGKTKIPRNGSAKNT